MTTDKDRAHEETPAGRYIVVWVGLLMLTGLTVAVSRLEPTRFAALVAVLIASVKAGGVLAFFMHLRKEPVILRLMLFVSVLALTLLIVLTFSDVGYRWGGHVHP